MPHKIRTAPEDEATALLDDPREPLGALITQLHSSPEGLSSREAARRTIVAGPNELPRRRSSIGRFASLLGQLTHPPALLLWMAAALSFVTGSVGWAIVAVILLRRDLRSSRSCRPHERWRRWDSTSRSRLSFATAYRSASRLEPSSPGTC